MDTPITHKNLIDDYKLGRRVNFLVEKYSMHRSAIQKILKKNGIFLRKASPKYYYNNQFFSEYTNESSYWAGFIMADGYIRKSQLHIKLSQRDNEHLLKFKESISFEGDVKVSKNKKSCYIDIHGPWYVEQLKEKYKILNRKSLIAEFPESLPMEFYRHFVRGYFDGDGCICCSRKYPSLSFVGTYKMMDSFRKLFKNVLNVTLQSGNEYPPLSSNKGKNTYQIMYSGKNVFKILNWMFQNSSNLTRMTRKHEKCLTLKEFQPE